MTSNQYRKGAKGTIYDSENKRAYGPEEASLEAQRDVYSTALHGGKATPAQWQRGVKTQKSVNRLRGLSKKNPVNPQGIDKGGHGNYEQFDTVPNEE